MDLIKKTLLDLDEEHGQILPFKLSIKQQRHVVEPRCTVSYAAVWEEDA